MQLIAKSLRCSTLDAARCQVHTITFCPLCYLLLVIGSLSPLPCKRSTHAMSRSPRMAVDAMSIACCRRCMVLIDLCEAGFLLHVYRRLANKIYLAFLQLSWQQDAPSCDKSRDKATWQEEQNPPHCLLNFWVLLQPNGIQLKHWCKRPEDP